MIFKSAMYRACQLFYTTVCLMCLCCFRLEEEKVWHSAWDLALYPLAARAVLRDRRPSYKINLNQLVRLVAL